MRPGDKRPYFVLVAVVALLLLALAIPTTRAWLSDAVITPLTSQVEPTGPREGYSVPSLAAWALLGGALGWVAYDLLFTRLALRPDRDFFIGLAPFLLFGPLFHALLVAGALPSGRLAYLAAEPLIYLTTAILAIAGYALGAWVQRPLLAPLLVGLVALSPLVGAASTRASIAGAGHVALLFAMALSCAVFIGVLYHKWKPSTSALAAGAVVGAHALDGATTWMVLRDPLGLGFVGFTEQNPVSKVLVELSNGWPYFAIKLVLPVVLLTVIRAEEGEEKMHAFLLLAVFVLGYGPGMSNLLQVLFS